MFPPRLLPRLAAALVSGLCLGPAQAAVATVNILETGVTVAGFPHKVDVYRPAGATRAIVFLHAHGGRSWQLAYDLGINRRYLPATARNVDWSALQRLGVIAVFPQGQVQAPSVLPTWSNHVFDSGQDDVAFLAALSAQARSAWGATRVALAGHSSGGTMTARMWCEGTTAFQAFFSIAGPMPSTGYPAYGQTCTPLAPRPYAVAIGDRDTKLSMFAAGIVQPTPEQMAAGLTDTILLSEWMRHGDRGVVVCGEPAALDGALRTTAGLQWSACAGRLAYTVVPGADHPIVSIEQHAGLRVLDWVAAFAAAAP
jgi:poly(3-hydroxybutyrate) depolymerase